MINPPEPGSWKILRFSAHPRVTFCKLFMTGWSLNPVACAHCWSNCRDYRRRGSVIAGTGGELMSARRCAMHQRSSLSLLTSTSTPVAMCVMMSESPRSLILLRMRVIGEAMARTVRGLRHRIQLILSMKVVGEAHKINWLDCGGADTVLSLPHGTRRGQPRRKAT